MSVLLFCAGLLILAPETPPGPGNDRIAAGFYREGRAAYRRQEYQMALDAFSRAHALKPKPFLLFNIALCHEKLRNYEQAIVYFTRYAQKVPDDAGPTEIRVRTLRQLLVVSKRNNNVEPGPGQSEKPAKSGKEMFRPEPTVVPVVAQPVPLVLPTPQILSDMPEWNLKTGFEKPPHVVRRQIVSRGLGVAGTILVSGGLGFGGYSLMVAKDARELHSWEWEQHDELASRARRAAVLADTLTAVGVVMLAAAWWLY